MADTILGELNPNARNPRTIDNEHLDMLKESIEEFGDLSGFVYNRRSQMLISGHQRQKVMPGNSEIVITKRHNPPTAKGTVADGYVIVNGEQFKYREVDWDDLKSKAGTIAANKHGGEWEKLGLRSWLGELDTARFNMKLTGFTQVELPKLIMFDVNSINKGDENAEWANMPEFIKGDSFFKIILCFKSEEERKEFAEKNSFEAEKVYSNQWILYR